MFLNDLKKGLFNNRMLFVFSVTFVLFYLSDYISIFKPMTFADLNAPDLQSNEEAVHFIYSNGHNKYQVWLQSFKYIGFLFPLLVLLPYGTSYFDEKQSNFHYYIWSRTSYRKYARNKFLVSGLVGGLSILLPEFVYYIVISIIFQNKMLESTMFQAQGPLSNMFQSTPELYIAFVLFTHFLIGCAFAAMGVCISTFVKKKIVVFVLPYLLYMGSGIILEGFLRIFTYSPLQWIQLMYNLQVNLPIMYGCLAILFIGSAVVFNLRARMV